MSRQPAAAPSAVRSAERGSQQRPRPGDRRHDRSQIDQRDEREIAGRQVRDAERHGLDRNHQGHADGDPVELAAPVEMSGQQTCGGEQREGKS